MAQLKTKILLFGRTGSGKSTLANMLIKGNLDPPLMFGTSSGIRGKTLDMQREESESRVVVDTVGFGEDEGGSVSDEEARNRLYNYFVKLSEGYHYFVYVQKWGKADYLDTNMWSFFKEAFKGAEDNFLVVFTHSKPEYIEQHQEDVRSVFVGCKRYVSVDFPTDRPHEVSKVKLRINNLLRVESFKRLESSLIHFMRPSILPWIVRNMSKGRLRLISECESSRYMITKLLVDGVLEHQLMIHTEVEGPSDLDFIEPGDWEFLDGRGWEVVNQKYTRLRVGSGRSDVYIGDENVPNSQSFSHIVGIIEDTCQRSAKELKRQWRLASESNFGILVVNRAAAGQQEMGQAKPILEVLEVFKHCAFVLYLHFPVMSTLKEIESQNMQIRKESLKILEDTLLAKSGTPNSRDEIRQGDVFALLWAEWRRMRSQTATNDGTWRDHKGSQLTTSRWVDSTAPFAIWKMKSRLTAPRILHVDIKYIPASNNSIYQWELQLVDLCEWELKLVDIFGKEKGVARHCFQIVPRGRSKRHWIAEVSERAFLDNMEQGDTIILGAILNTYQAGLLLSGFVVAMVLLPYCEGGRDAS